MSAEEFTVIDVRLQPSARKDAICEWMADGALKIRVKSKPVEGKANINLIKLLSKRLGIPKSSVEIIAGEKSRKKVIKIWGLNKKDLLEIIAKILIQDP